MGIFIKCTKCGENIENLSNYSYGFNNGKSFIEVLCDKCSKSKNTENGRTVGEYKEEAESHRDL